jgi:hypothetical protein
LPPPSAPEVPTPLPDLAKGGPDGAAIEAAQNAALPRMQACLDASDLGVGRFDVEVQYMVQPDGKATGISVSGAPPSARDCLTKAVGALSFPTFSGAGMTMRSSLSYSRASK